MARLKGCKVCLGFKKELDALLGLVIGQGEMLKHMTTGNVAHLSRNAGVACMGMVCLLEELQGKLKGRCTG